MFQGNNFYCDFISNSLFYLTTNSLEVIEPSFRIQGIVLSLSVCVQPLKVNHLVAARFLTLKEGRNFQNGFSQTKTMISYTTPYLVMVLGCIAEKSDKAR